MRLKMIISYCIGLLLLLTVVPGGSFAAVPQQINYQGYLAGSDGNPVADGDYEISFAIYYIPEGGTPLWGELQTVPVTNGIYNVILGQPGNLLDPDDFDGDLYLGVAVGEDDEMTPRQKITATAFTLKAAKADDADTLDGKDSTALDQSAHVARTDNPHSVTAAQLGAIITETDPTVPASVKDGVSWSELSGIPAGFADGVDNTGITAETDPQVGSISWNYIPKWNGWELVSGDIFNPGGKVGIGTNNPVYGKLHVYTSEDNNAVYSISTGAGSGLYAVSTDTDNGLHGVVGITYNSNQAGVYGENYGAGPGVIADGGSDGVAVELKDGGIKFPDGTVQTTAPAPTWHQKLPAAERFVLVMDNQAVLDKETGLVWARNANIYNGTKTWQAAIDYCANLSISDRKGWRLPEREELASLLDMSVSGSPKLPAGYSSFFTNVQSGYYWSSTTYEGDSTLAWDVSMSDGFVYDHFKDSNFYVWPVRSDN